MLSSIILLFVYTLYCSATGVGGSQKEDYKFSTR